MVWKVCLLSWMTHELVLQTGKHTSAIWRLFSQLWLPMASSSIWKSVFLQHLPLKVLDTRFQRQDQPQLPITPPKSKTAHTQDIKQLQRFLGMVNFFHCFLPNCAQVLKPLTDLLRGGGQNFGVDRFRPGGIPKC